MWIWQRSLQLPTPSTYHPATRNIPQDNQMPWNLVDLDNHPVVSTLQIDCYNTTVGCFELKSGLCVPEEYIRALVYLGGRKRQEAREATRSWAEGRGSATGKSSKWNNSVNMLLKRSTLAQGGEGPDCRRGRVWASLSWGRSKWRMVAQEWRVGRTSGGGGILLNVWELKARSCWSRRCDIWGHIYRDRVRTVCMCVPTAGVKEASDIYLSRRGLHSDQRSHQCVLAAPCFPDSHQKSKITT